MSAEEIQLEIAHRLLIDIIGSSERFFSSTVSRNSLHFTSNSPRKMAQSRAADRAPVPRACVARPPFCFDAEVFLLSKNFISGSNAYGSLSFSVNDGTKFAKNL